MQTLPVRMLLARCWPRAGLDARILSIDALILLVTITRARFKDALSDLSLDLGGYRTRFTPPSLTGSHFVDVVAIDRTGRVIG